jgi:hypothetical protein
MPTMPPSVDDKHTTTVSLLQLKSPKEEPMATLQRSDPTASPMVSAVKNQNPSQNLAPIGSPDTNSKQYTILQPAGVGSRAASAIQDIAREGVVSVAAVSSTGESSGGAASAVAVATAAAAAAASAAAAATAAAASSSSVAASAAAAAAAGAAVTRANGASCIGNGPAKQSSNAGGGGAGAGANPGCATGAGGNGAVVQSNGIVITTMTATATATTTSPAAIGDVPVASVSANHQENGIKLADRTAPFDGTRPPMSMSPSSLGRGKFHNDTNISFFTLSDLRILATLGSQPLPAGLRGEGPNITGLTRFSKDVDI